MLGIDRIGVARRVSRRIWLLAKQQMVCSTPRPIKASQDTIRYQRIPYVDIGTCEWYVLTNASAYGRVLGLEGTGAGRRKGCWIRGAVCI